MKNQSILDIEVSRKRLLIRADLNVPINDGKITDDTRIKRFCQGMLKLLQKGAKLIIVTHMGRPKGIKQSTLSTKVLINSLEKYLEKEAVFSDNCIEHNTIYYDIRISNTTQMYTHTHIYIYIYIYINQKDKQQT